jgi:hypothetical protein
MIELLAKVLALGKGCPVCGGNKTERARTCKTCLKKVGPEATQAVDAVIETYTKAAEGNAEASKGAFKRGTVFGPVLAQVKIDKDALFHIANGKIESYWDCSKSIPGGFISVYVFGASEDQNGKTVTAMVDFKIKEHRPGDIIHYCRAQVVSNPQIHSDVKLQIVAQDQSDSFEYALPAEFVEEGKDKKRKYAVGFQYINKEARLPKDALVDKIISTVTKPQSQTETSPG